MGNSKPKLNHYLVALSMKLGIRYVCYAVIIIGDLIVVLDWNTQKSPAYTVDLAAVAPDFLPVQDRAGQQVGLTHARLGGGIR